jgi:hypothetical protein
MNPLVTEPASLVDLLIHGDELCRDLLIHGDELCRVSPGLAGDAIRLYLADAF